MRRLIGTLAALLLLAAGAAPSSAGVGALGTWVMDSGKVTVTIHPCGASLCGTIVALKKPNDKHGRPKRDKRNPNPALRDRPVVGLTIISGMRPDGNNSWSGSIYNADDGYTYRSYMNLEGNLMKVQGCVAFICKKLTFQRAH